MFANALPRTPLAIGDVLELVTDAMLAVAAVMLVLIVVGAIAATRPGVRARLAGSHERAFGWIDRAIGAWHAEGRLTDAETDRLRAELREPDFAAVLPHLGVHLAIGVALRFPIGSITRATYVLSNIAIAHVRFVTRRIDGAALRRSMGIHSPLVLLLTCLPGIGTFAYLASKPFRAHHLLARVALDAVLLKLPKRVYERSGARPILTRPARRAASDGSTGELYGLRIRLVPARIVAALAVVTVGLFAADVAMAVIDHVFAPSFLGWEPILRILDLNAESSIGTWFATTMLLLCATLLSVIALGKRRAGDRFARHWAGLALIVLGLAIDEQAKLHDLGSGFGAAMRERLGLGGVLYYGWVIVAAATIGMLAVLYWRFVFALPRSTRTRFIVAGGLYLAGEMGMEMVGGSIMDGSGATLAYALSTSVEEFLAMMGVLVAFGSLLGEARSVARPVSIEIAAPEGAAAAIDVTDVVIQTARDASRRDQAPVSTVQIRP